MYNDVQIVIGKKTPCFNKAYIGIHNGYLHINIAYVAFIKHIFPGVAA